jgi:hypothetical protein
VIVLSLFIWDIPVVEIAGQTGGSLNSDVQVGGWLALIGAVGLLISARSNCAFDGQP